MVSRPAPLSCPNSLSSDTSSGSPEPLFYFRPEEKGIIFTPENNNMSLHINARPEDIAPVVLMPGDPLRAKFIAENYLQDVRQVAHTRNMLYFTGTYQGVPLTVGASGMGCASIGIYSYELFHEYGVRCIMRIGTAGSYRSDIGVYSLINVDRACSESTYARYAFGMEEEYMDHQGKSFACIQDTARRLNQPLLSGPVHSSDVFYRTTPALPELASRHNCLAVEMEAFALFANARQLGRSAATLLTVSDVIPTGANISPDERERALRPMISLALESALDIQKNP